MMLIQMHFVFLYYLLISTGKQIQGIASEKEAPISLAELLLGNSLTEHEMDFHKKDAKKTSSQSDRGKQDGNIQKMPEDSDYVTQEEFEELEKELDVQQARMNEMEVYMNKELNHLNKQQQQQQVELSDHDGRISHLENLPEVAFFACGIASSDARPVSFSSHQIIKYYYTKVNQGGHYSTSTGKFRCPVTGIYFFSFSVFADKISRGADSAMGSGGLMRNGQKIAEAYIVNDDKGGVSGTFSNSAVVSCSSGQYVWVESLHDNNHLYNWRDLNVFTGMLLYV